MADLRRFILAYVCSSLRSVLVCWLDMYPEDFFEPPDFASLVQLIEFSRHHELNDVKTKARKLKERYALTSAEGGMKSNSVVLHCLYLYFDCTKWSRRTV